MANLLKRVTDKMAIRKDFLEENEASISKLDQAGRGNELTTVGSGLKGTTSNDEGKWLPVACWHNCGGRCLNKALVVDGVVVRQKTDDTHPDSPDFPQQRGCLRGRSQRYQVFGADRLKYPMKRKHWEPGGGDRSLRGKDEWVRISWDEALDIIADQIKSTVAKYGNRSIYAPGGDEIFRTLSLYGGFTSGWGTSSPGNWGTSHYLGFSPLGLDTNDRFDFKTCDYIVMFGCNPAWSSPGNPSFLHKQCKEAGVKYIAIDPYFNDTYAMLDADWIPIHPVSDTALLLGIAYVMITEDDPNTKPLIDWDFLKRCTIGFNADMMPEGEDPKGNFMDYVLGTYDGIPKDPQWASERCGAMPEKIRELAHILSKNNKVAIIMGWASARTRNTDSLPQLFMTIGSMGGHFGKSGHMTSCNVEFFACNGGPSLVKAGTDGIPSINNPVDDSINDADSWKAIDEGVYNFTGKGTYSSGQLRDIDIHMIYYGGLNGFGGGFETAGLQTKPGMSRGIELHRKKIDFIVSQSHFLTTNSKYADLVLPVTTEWERPGRLLEGNREMLLIASQVTEPLYEAKDDQWIAIEIAKRLGIDEKEVYPFGRKQQFFNKIATSTVVKDDGVTYQPLVAISEEDIKEWGVVGTPQQGRIGLKEFLSKGVYQVERSVSDNFGYIAYKAFRDDPEANPRPSSASGKFEIFSRSYANRINAMGYSTIEPIPMYILPSGGYEESFVNWKDKIKGEYPFQMFSPHYLRRSHSSLDNIGWLREAFTNPVFINASDAAEHGIAPGDTVLVSSQFGRTLRHACLTQRLYPGTIALPHGSWVDIDERTGIDTGGADNILCGNVTAGQGTAGWNSCLVKIEKFSGTPIVPDVKKPQRVIF